MASNIEEDYAKNSIEQAKEFLREGNYSKALHYLGRAERLRPNFQGISELVAITEVCHAAAWKCSCRLQTLKSKTPDWYRVLKIEENADMVSIKKRYRQLALLLHPDKNKNVKAEEAFKLVSEAYACLSDKELRRNFTIERARRFCLRCSSSESMNSQRKPENVDEHPKSDQEMLQEFRERARARVNKLTEDIKSRRSRWTADLESAREKYQNKRVDRKKREDVFHRPIKESDVFQPSTNRKFHVTPDTDLMNVLRGRRNLQREKFVASQSLDGFLSKLRSEARAMRSGSGKHRDVNIDNLNSGKNNQGKSFGLQKKTHDKDGSLSRTSMDNQQAKSSGDSVITSRFFSKRVSSGSGSEAFAGRKYFKEDAGEEDEELSFSSGSSQSQAQDREEEVNSEAALRSSSYPVFERKNRAEMKPRRAKASTAPVMDENSEPVEFREVSPVPEVEMPERQTPPVQRNVLSGNRACATGDELNQTRKETSQTVCTSTFCCSKTTMLKEQRQKSEELLKTLERLREEARFVAETLDKLKRSSESDF